MPDFKGFFKKIGDSIGFNIPSLDISSEREEEIIEKLSGFAIKSNLEFPMMLVGWWFQPVSPVVAKTALLPMATFLEFLGIKGFEYVAFLNKKENIGRLLERINELERTKKKRPNKRNIV